MRLNPVFARQQERLKKLPQGVRLTRENEDNTGLIVTLLFVGVIGSAILYCVIGLGWVF